MNTMQPQHPDTILKVDNLRVSFDTLLGVRHALRGVSFELQRGKTLAIVGESGSGKSVSSQAILRIIRQPGRIVGGSITFHPRGEEPVEITTLADKSERLFRLRGAQIGMIFQEPMTALSPVHTVGDQVAEAILLHRPVSRKDAWKIATDMLDRVGITQPDERMRQFPFELSGGMRQRVVIAMALVCRPEILIADEPTTALDVTIQAQILELIEELKCEMGTSVIFITHDLGVVAQIADDVVVMNQGLVMESGPVRDIFKDPLHPYTQRLLAAMPRLDSEGAHGSASGGVTGGGFEAPDGYSVMPPGGHYQGSVEPSLFRLADGREVLIWPEVKEVAT